MFFLFLVLALFVMAHRCPINDEDGDGVPDSRDNCPEWTNSDQTDTDDDGFGEPCDNCPYNSNPGQEDTDEDGMGDACDSQ